MRKLALPLLAALLASTTACYHATIETGRPASSQQISKPWANSFIAGLVPPATIETASQCPNGVARVETQLSFLNQVVSAVTLGIYTPMTITVTCAAGGRTSSAGERTPTVVAEGATAEQKAAALDAAIEQAKSLEAPVLVQFR
jgi:hypothetical protein